MTDQVSNALANDQVIDITTIGRKSGEPRRIEIWFHRLEGRFYITGTPDRPRSWYANLEANPMFVFHLKTTTIADLHATARLIAEPSERGLVFAGILPSATALSTKASWVENSPLVEVVFDR
ncbi:MAG TPA: nitroreductase/quinone reductase family protein [Galbitalea sp.]|jgi:deazaflavin-dependent oxidoreductase (nitroreductase family)|nr:nitroreductase/quinone reductase family protein [Galbitalea sp.]